MQDDELLHRAKNVSNYIMLCDRNLNQYIFVTFPALSAVCWVDNNIKSSQQKCWRWLNLEVVGNGVQYKTSRDDG